MICSLVQIAMAKLGEIDAEADVRVAPSITGISDSFVVSNHRQVFSQATILLRMISLCMLHWGESLVLLGSNLFKCVGFWLG